MKLGQFLCYMFLFSALTLHRTRKELKLHITYYILERTNCETQQVSFLCAFVLCFDPAQNTKGIETVHITY